MNQQVWLFDPRTVAEGHSLQRFWYRGPGEAPPERPGGAVPSILMVGGLLDLFSLAT
ncbi:MAG TPA: hypothetical protein PKM43_08885 [Verrucomicrobiota bacterium]|nr:hypothetical protein [Verrucomicrobiota bacterium]HRZ55535.1 hypothetical protein [Candidatus Paceibacterota bacterium]